MAVLLRCGLVLPQAISARRLILVIRMLTPHVDVVFQVKGLVVQNLVNTMHCFVKGCSEVVVSTVLERDFFSVGEVAGMRVFLLGPFHRKMFSRRKLRYGVFRVCISD